MNDWFKTTGDFMPNSKEIHLELQQKNEIYLEYQRTCIEFYKDDTFLSYSRFVTLWEQLYPHVKIRVFKQVNCLAVIFENVNDNFFKRCF